MCVCMHACLCVCVWIECWVNVINACDLPSCFVCCVVSHSGICVYVSVKWFLTEGAD